MSNVTRKLVTAACIGLLALPSLGLASVVTEWSKPFNLPGWGVAPEDVAIDVDGNVYVAANRSNGGVPEALFTKFSHTGVFLWSRVFTGVGGELDPRIEVTQDGRVFVSYRHAVTDNFAAIARLSTENGMPLWQRYYPSNGNADLLVKAEPGEAPVVVSLFNDLTTTPQRVRAVILSEHGAVMGQHVYYPPLDWAPVDAEIYGDQFAYLVAAPTAVDRFPSRIVRVGFNGSIRGVTDMGVASQLAYTSAGGGRLWTVGVLSDNSLEISMVNALTGQVLGTETDTLPQSVVPAIFDAEADESGSLFVAGGGTASGISDPMLVRYSFPGMQRQWSFDMGGDTQEERFEHLAIDRFGTAYAVSLGAQTGARVAAVDTLSGRLMGVAEHTHMLGLGRAFNTLAVNSRGMVGHALSRDLVNDQLVVQQARATGLLNVTLPGTRIVGGKQITGTIRLYKAATFNRSIALESSSALLQVPGFVSVPIGATEVTFKATVFVPATDMEVRLFADDGQALRKYTFTLAKP